MRPAADSPDLAAVEAARARLAGVVDQTPCAHSRTLSGLTGAACWVKLENLQMTGSFKERGAANLLLQLGPDERAAASSPPAPATTAWPSPTMQRSSAFRRSSSCRSGRRW